MKQVRTVKTAWNRFKTDLNIPPAKQHDLKIAFYAGAAWMSGQMIQDIKRLQHDMSNFKRDK